MKLYGADGNILILGNMTGGDIPVTRQSQHTEELMKDNYVTLAWNDTVRYQLPTGSYIIPFPSESNPINADDNRYPVRFTLFEPYEPESRSIAEFSYEPHYQHPIMWFDKLPFVLLSGNVATWNDALKKTDWSYTGSATQIAQRVVEEINWLAAKDELFGELIGTGWVAVVDNDLASSASIKFDNLSIMSAASEIANAYDCEFHFDYDRKQFRLGVIKYGTQVTLKSGVNVGNASISRTKEEFANAFIVRGSTRNLSQPKSNGEYAQVTERLTLDESQYPDSVIYTDDNGNVVDKDAFDESGRIKLFKELIFDGVYPKLDLYIYNPRERKCYLLDSSGNRVIDDRGLPVLYSKWYIRLAYPVYITDAQGNKIVSEWRDYLINEGSVIDGTTLGITFLANEDSSSYNSQLAGQGDFDLVYFDKRTTEKEADDVSPDGFTAEAGDYRIVFKETNGVIIPTTSSGGIYPQGASTPTLNNNKATLINIVISDEYKEIAKNELETQALRKVRLLKKDLNNYTLPSDAAYFEENETKLHIGQNVIYNDGQDLNGGTPYLLDTHIIKIVTQIDYPWVQEITVGNQRVKGPTTRLKEEVANISRKISGDESQQEIENLQRYVNTVIQKNIADLQKQLDGQQVTYFGSGEPTLSNYPASEWAVADYPEHIGDMYYDKASGKPYVFEYNEGDDVYQWTYIEDPDIKAALEAAANAQDTADGKRRVFVSEPKKDDAYDEGDLWVNATYPSGNTTTDESNHKYHNDILKCIKAKRGKEVDKDGNVTYPGDDFSINDWSLASKYTDDSSLNNFINGEYKQDLDNVRAQTDAKAETWYQGSDPSSAWTTTDLKEIHLGDIWLDTTPDANGNTHTYIYRKSGNKYGWEEVNGVPTAVFDMADGKASIYVSKPANYKKNDLWIIESGLSSTDMPTGCQAGDIVISSSDSNSYKKAHWTKKDRYTDDTYAHSFDYLSAAIKGKTEVDGGLVLTNTLVLRDISSSGTQGDIMSGINGIIPKSGSSLDYTGIAAWYGGQMKDYEAMSETDKAKDWSVTKYAKSLFRFDGSGYVAGGNLSWDKDGAVTIQGTTINATTLQVGGSNVATQAMLDNYVSKEWFKKLFKVHVGTDTDGTNVVEPNGAISGDAYTIEAMFGFWTKKYLSALGKNDDTSGGGGIPDKDGVLAILGEFTSQEVFDNTDFATRTWVNANFPVDKKSTLEKITDAKITDWDATTTWYKSITGSDTDDIINKWNEIITFLEGIPDQSKLADILAAKANSTVKITAGTGLTGGGDLSEDRTLSLATSGVTAGTYTKVTVDQYGRVTSGSNPTTLDGYGITDAYTKDEIDNKVTTINTSIGNKADRTRKIATDNGLQGGGDLTEDRTLSIRLQTNSGLAVASAGLKLDIVNNLTTANDYKAISATQAKKIWDLLNQMFTLENTGTSSAPVYRIKANYGLYSEQYISTLGANSDSGSGSGELDEGKMWSYLGGSMDNKVIALTHIPDLDTLTFTYGSVTSASDITYNGHTTRTVVIPKKLSDLTNDLTNLVTKIKVDTTEYTPQSGVVTIPVKNNNTTVSWNTETTIATIGKTAIKIKIPANPNTTYTFAEGSTDGAFSVTPSGGSAQSVTIYGFSTVKSNATNGNTAYGYFDGGVLPISKGGTGKTSAFDAIENLGGLSIKSRGTAIPTTANIDTYITAGRFYANDSGITAALIDNGNTIPISGAGFELTVVQGYLDGRRYQYLSSTVDKGLWRRGTDDKGASWKNWQRFAFASDLASYLPLAGGTMTGTINSQIVQPKTTNAYTLGGASYRWSNVYSVLGNFSGLLTANGSIYIPTGKYLRIGDAYLTYDSSAKMIKIWDNAGTEVRGIYATGAVSSLGSNTDTSGGGVVDEEQVWGYLASTDASKKIHSSHIDYEVSVNGNALTGISVSNGGKLSFAKDYFVKTVNRNNPDGANVVTDVSYNNAGTLTVTRSKVDFANKTDLNSYFAISGGISISATSTSQKDLNDYTDVGSYYQANGNNAEYVSNKPNGETRSFRLWVINTNGNTGYLRQRYQGWNKETVYERYSQNSGTSWSAWVKVSDDLGGYITGIANTANANTLTITKGDGSTSTFTVGYATKAAQDGNGKNIANTYATKESLEDATTDITTLKGYFTNGVANVAAKLNTGTTTYSAWGQTYWQNGVPKSVSGNMTGVGSISMSGNLRMERASGGIMFNMAAADQTADYITALRTFTGSDTLALGYETTLNKSFATNIYGKNIYLLYKNSNDVITNGLTLLSSGNVGIGNTSPSYKLHINGTLGVANAVTLSGDTTAKKRITFGTGTTAGYIEYDATTGLFHFSKGIYSDGAVSALGANSDTSGGGTFDEGDMWTWLATPGSTHKIDNSHLNFTIDDYMKKSVTGETTTGTLTQVVTDVQLNSNGGLKVTKGAITLANYLPLAGNSSSTPMAGNIYFNNNKYLYWKGTDNSSKLVLGLKANNVLLLGYETAAAGYSTIIYGNSIEFRYSTSRTTGLTLASGGDVTIAKNLTVGSTITNTGTVTANSFVKSGGTSAQFLKADGSVDGNTYLTTTSASSSYVSALGTSGNYLTWTKNGNVNNITVPYATTADRLPYCYVYGNNKGAGWWKAASCSCTVSSIATYGATFYVSSQYYKGCGILEVLFRKEANATTFNTTYTRLRWISRDATINPDHFKLVVTVNSATDMTCDLYYYQNAVYGHKRFYKIDDGGFSARTTFWTLASVSAAGTTLPTESTTVKHISCTDDSYAANAGMLNGVAATGYVTIAGAQTITGAKTFDVDKLLVNGGEVNDNYNQSTIQFKTFGNSTYYNYGNTALVNSLSAIRNSVVFNWYNTAWVIGNIRGGGTDSYGFGFGCRFNNSGNVLDRMHLTSTGNLSVYGTITSGSSVTSGNEVTASSDLRLKNIDGNIKLSVKDIASAPSVYYWWKDKRDEKKHIGSIAQYWEKVLPESVSYDGQGYMSLNYQSAALVAAIAIAREVSEHESRLTKLERENKALKKRITELEARRA